MNNLLKNLLIGLLLPNLALGQTVALSTAAGDEERQPMSASVTNNSSARPQTSAKAKAWTSVAVSIVSVGVALFALGYAVTVRSENHSLAARGEEKDNELHNLSLEIKKGRTTQQQELETKNTELQQLKDRFTALEDAHKQSLAECQKLNDLYSTQTKSFKSLDSAYKELGQQYTLVGEAKTTLEKECRQQAKKLQSYQDREQELQDNAVSLEAKTKEIQSRLGAVQLREHESQTMRENLETQAKQIAAQKTEADLLIKTLTAEKTHLESLASTFEKLIIDNTTLQADLQLKASVVNATIEKDPTLQAAVTEKKQQERPLFSVFNATKNSTLDFPPELILVILDLCGFENLKSLLMLNKETNQSMKACINKSPAIFFQKVYPSFISLETKPVEIFGVPPLDENLFKEPTPVKLLQSLPKVFKHQDTKKQKHYFLPLPYAKDFLGLLKEVAVKHPAIKEIFNAHPLPVWIGPVIKLTPFQTDVTLDEKQNIAVYNALYCDAMDASMTELKGAGTLVRQHPHVLLRTPKDHSILYPYNNRRDTPIARLLRTFLEEFLQPYPVTPIPGQHFTQCVSLCGWIYECMIGYGPGPENLYTKIRTLCNSMEATKQSALQTIHIPSHTNCLNKTIPLVCKEIVLGSGTIKTNNEEEDDDEDTIALYNLHYLLGTRKYGPNSHTREQAHEPIPHNVQILRFLNYSFDQKSVQRIPFAYQNIPHLIIHVPEGWQLTEDIKAALQTRVKNSKTLQSITLMTECKNMNWHASKQLGQFLKTVTPPQTS